MYEHALAKMEFKQGFHAGVAEPDELDPWLFSVSANGSTEDLGDRSAYAGDIDGQETVYGRLIKPAYQGGEYNRTRSVNQYLTHWIYPYKGKFHPQIIRAILNIIGVEPGHTVLDPFIGSGTTALECQMLGLDCIGVDVSPLCAQLTRVKTTAWSVADDISLLVERLLEHGSPHPDELASFEGSSAEVSSFVEIARMVTYSDVARRKKDAKACFERNIRNMAASVDAMARARRDFSLALGSVSTRHGDARHLSTTGIQASSVDAVVTSPPYSIALDYVKNDEHALEAMGLDTNDIRENFIGVRGRGADQRLGLYEEDLKLVFSEMARVLKPGAPAVVVIGNATVGGEEHRTTDHVIDWASRVGLVFEREMPKIAWGLYGVVADEKIIFFRRAKE